MKKMVGLDNYTNNKMYFLHLQFMGVYDYDPSKNSPYEHPSCELAFKAGDIITVFGKQRGDGFYYAEVRVTALCF